LLRCWVFREKQNFGNFANAKKLDINQRIGAVW